MNEKEKYLVFPAGERTCYECGEKFQPVKPDEILTAEVGDEIYCRCPNPEHGRYTMAKVEEIS